MSLILGKDGFRKFQVGYPTKTNLVDIQGGLLEGTAGVKPGDLLIYGTAAGKFKPFASGKGEADLAGFVVATNVKLTTAYPADGAAAEFKPGEALNVLPVHQANVGGYIAVKLSEKVTIANVAPGKKVAFFAAGEFIGQLTTTGQSDGAQSPATATTATDLVGVYFTGNYENIGTSVAPIYVAEIAING